MSGEYFFNFDPSAQIAPITIHPGEFNSALIPNKLQILQTTSDNVVSVYGDFTYRFTPGLMFAIVNSTSNDGNYTVIESQYLPKTEIVGINSIQRTITIVGNGSIIFRNHRVFTIQSSTFNNGKWMVRSSSFDGTNTTIRLASIADGDVLPSTIRDGNSIEDATIDGFVETAITAILVHEPIVDSTNTGILEYLIPSEEVGSSLSLPGRGAPNPGEHINQNMLDLLSNYASTTPPRNPVSGQLWYDMSKINVWNPSTDSWETVGGLSRLDVDRHIVEPVPGTTLIVTPTYELGSNTLSIYCNGKKLYPSIDYTEVSSGLASLTSPTLTGDQFMFEVLRLA